MNCTGKHQKGCNYVPRFVGNSHSVAHGVDTGTAATCDGAHRARGLRWVVSHRLAVKSCFTIFQTKYSLCTTNGHVLYAIKTLSA